MCECVYVCEYVCMVTSKSANVCQLVSVCHTLYPLYPPLLQVLLQADKCDARGWICKVRIHAIQHMPCENKQTQKTPTKHTHPPTP